MSEPDSVSDPEDGARQVSPQEVDAERTQLLTRFILGFMIVGTEQLSQRLRSVGDEIKVAPEIHAQEPEAYDDTAYDLLRYLAIGAVMRGERKVVRGVSSGFRKSYRATGWLLRKLNSAADNRLTRPFRRPVEDRVKRFERTLDSYVREGRFEEQRSRLLATEAVGEISEEAIDWVAHSPDVNLMVRQIVAGQGVGLASVAQDNARQASVTGDSALEGIVRRILRMTPRDQLPPSPLAGQPQTMYAPETQLEALGDDE